jgi:hypothetical protein
MLLFDTSLFPVLSAIWPQAFPLPVRLQIYNRQDFAPMREKYENVRGTIPVI